MTTLADDQELELQHTEIKSSKLGLRQTGASLALRVEIGVLASLGLFWN